MAERCSEGLVDSAAADAAALEAFGAWYDRAREAVTRAGSISRSFRIAGRRATLEFAGPSLTAPMTAAIAHLGVTGPGTADLTVIIWDSASTGLAAPPAPIASDEAWSVHTPRFRALALPALQSVAWYDRDNHIAIYWTMSASRVPVAEHGSPLLTLWAWWLDDSSVQLTHAAALGSATGAALIVGPGGSGKSSTAIGALRSPLKFLADDYCLVETAGAPVVHSLFSSGKVNAEDESRYDWLRPVRALGDHEKTLYLFHPMLAEQLAIALPLRAILIATVSGDRDTAVVRASAMAALRAVAPSTLLQLRVGTDKPRALKRIADMARHVSAWHLRLGTDRTQIPGVIERLLA